MNRQVLVVDDDPKIRKAIEQGLTQEGFRVLQAGSGEEALTLAATARPDLIILDIMLPGQDGFQVCGKLRAQGSTPIIFLSARGDEVDKVVGFKLGCDDYLTKPFSLSELVLRVHAVLRRSHSAPVQEHPETLRVRGLEIERATRIVRVKGREVELRPKEFDLLWLLAGHPRQVFSRETLMERIWQDEASADPSAVTVCIRRLREKIEDNPGAPEYIKTVWGIGYKFEG